MSSSYKEIEENNRNAAREIKLAFLSKVSENENYAEETAEVIFNRLVTDLMMEVTLDAHRAFQLGYSHCLFSDEGDNTDLSSHQEIVESKSEDINCPKCTKLVHASRFAPHLEKCMLMGRSSSRIASQRIANNSKECSYGGGSDDDDDWKATPEKSRSAKKSDGKRKKPPVSRAKPYKVDNSKDAPGTSSLKDAPQTPSKLSSKDNSNLSKSIKDTTESDIWNSPNKLSPQSIDDKSGIFAGKCGVKSDITGKYCGRSLRCHRHSDAERAVARKILNIDTSMEVDSTDDVDQPKNVIGNFSALKLTPPTTPSSAKKKEKRSTYSKF